MKYFTFILFFTFSLQLVYSQEPIESKQFLIGIDNVLSTDVVDHTIEPIGTYWEIDDNDDWIISSDPLGESSTITTVGNSNFSKLGTWDGWNFFWLNNTEPPNEDWGLGFYKVTNDYNSEYFYIDCRVDAFGENRIPYPHVPDFFVHLDAGEPEYNYDDSSTPVWNTIGIGDVVRIWDVHDVNPPNSNSLEDFWDNVLVAMDGVDDHPLIV